MPKPGVMAKVESADDLASIDLASGTNILEEAEDDSEEAAAPTPGPKVPNFKGMTMRAVLSEAAAKGLNVQPDGSGIAKLQSPPPGAPLRQGERIRVQFAR